MTRFTPSPWLRDGRTVYALNEDNTNRFSARIEGGFQSKSWRGQVWTPSDEVEATAVLICAAPEMLEALKAALDYLLNEAESRKYNPPVDATIIANLEHAIAKAEGRS